MRAGEPSSRTADTSRRPEAGQRRAISPRAHQASTGMDIQPRNVVIIMSDEHNADFMGCAGHPVVATPHLDKLSVRGARFPNAYTPSPICVPARAAFATGLRVHQTRHWD